MKEPLTIYMMCSSHWDREWYVPFQDFRWRLVNITDEVMDKLEAYPEIQTFTFDGQTIVLEDYMEIAPEQKERLQGLIQQGRIKVGPWYVMADEWLCSGESLIRNLQVGTAIAKAWGVEPMRYGYLCDIFGHVAQMPQILAGFDMEGALLGRGITDHEVPAHFRWEAPDGSQVTTFKTPDKFGYGEFWVRIHCFDRWREPPTQQEWDDNLKAYIDGELQRTDIPVLMLVDGQDHKHLHHLTLMDTKARLERLYPGCRVIIASPDEMLPALASYQAQMPRWVGEMNRTNRQRGDFARLLTNTLSSRYDLKQQNDLCQTLLEKWAGPITAVSRLTGRQPIRKAYYELAYRYLLKNQPHDSICGCSSNQVHRDMHHRYEQVRQIQHNIEDYGMKVLSRCGDAGWGENHILSIFNPLPFARRETVEAELWFDNRYPQRWGDQAFGSERVNGFVLVDEKGQEVPYRVVRSNRGRARIVMTNGERKDCHRIVFEAQLAPGGITEYRVVPREGYLRPTGSLRTGTYTAENEYIRLAVEPADGTVTIEDKRTGEVYARQLTFMDDGEMGDGYLHATPVEDKLCLSAGSPVSIEVTCDAACKCTFTIRREMMVPAEMMDNTERVQGYHRSDRLVPVTLSAQVSLTASSPMVEVELTVHNTARDHRLRLAIPTGVGTGTYRASQAFCMVERKVGVDPATLGYEERDQFEKAMDTFAYKREGQRGLAFISGGGLHEIGSFPGKEGMLAVTLLRCFSSVVQGQYSEDGQMQGEWTYRFGLLPLCPEDTDAQLQRMQDAFVTGIRYREDTQTAAKPRNHSYYRLEGENTLLSTVKVAEDDQGIVLRLYNMSGVGETARLTLDRVPQEVALVNLEEQHPVALPLEGTQVAVEMPPWAIRTVYVRY